MKTCIRCGKEHTNVRYKTCEKCLEYQRQWRARWHRTKIGVIKKAYSRLKDRISGRVKHTRHIYAGLPACSREEFTEWAVNDENFHRLYDTWKESGYTRRLLPTIDRLNTRNGYVIPNIRWVSYSENIIRGNRERWLR